MKKFFKLFLSLSLVLFSNLRTVAQQADDVEMADVLRSNGKIYVVVAVLLVVLSGLIIFLVRIDRKVSRLEKKNQSNP